MSQPILVALVASLALTPIAAGAEVTPDAGAHDSGPQASASAHTGHEAVVDAVIAAQRAALQTATDGAGFGPQSPRDIDRHDGSNLRVFGFAPDPTRMNLCNIHFHEGAEHRGGDFTTYAGNGDGSGYGTGYLYNGTLSLAELTPYDHPVGNTGHGALEPGDTIEVHFVFSTAQVAPGATLGSCLDDETGNPQLRVETQVMVLVNDDNAANFGRLAQVQIMYGYAQVPNLPTDTGTPVVYTGSTTGPSYNEAGSPFQVTWSVRPQVMRVSISSVDAWLADNAFDEDHAHGVRNLVINPALLSRIED
ncbi:delta-class carbonic anhydrase [Pararhodobacter zhoushanensis]|uniref:Delta-class carbonic anhydrase n=1 Tax=Pararhodobacter zhoushanensis TaxID=2479545 RepID=A0ABT3H4R6_9RHOB|nr:delta-class carbonic anhydrase [Pararhodobacter zhoushanensis]MCW1934791.1 delta-class carbonic anhydrase [Pararhodobacter zhoushanensis]